VAERRKLRREFGTVDTSYGRVAVKYGKLDGKVVQASPEFESCKRVADQNSVPVKLVYDAANRAIKL
jgi:pyridinium-3,5-bisthiocarboxylic acid mononucleotide nickel chelatase